MLNRDSLTRSAVGRVSCPFGVFRRQPRADPVMILIVSTPPQSFVPGYFIINKFILTYFPAFVNLPMI